MLFLGGQKILGNRERERGGSGRQFEGGPPWTYDICLDSLPEDCLNGPQPTALYALLEEIIPNNDIYPRKVGTQLLSRRWRVPANIQYTLL